MRFLFVTLLLTLLCNSSQAVTIHDLTFRLSYDKHVFPGRLLRGDIDAPKLMVQAVYYYKEALYTGTVSDTSMEFIEAVFDQGKIISYRRDWDARNYYRYNVISSDQYSWYATDVTFTDGRTTSRTEYYLEPGGTYRMTQNWFYDQAYNNAIETNRYIIGIAKGKKIKFNAPLQDGLQEYQHGNGFVTRENYRSGIRDGVYEQLDSAGNVIDYVYFSADSESYQGSFLHIDPMKHTREIGQYHNGFISGVWITTSTINGSVVQKKWFNEQEQELDSVKTWYANGTLQCVTYNFTMRKHGVTPWRTRNTWTWFENGKIKSVDYGDGRDTLHVDYAANGLIQFVRYRNGKHLTLKSWFAGTLVQEYEHYYNCDQWMLQLYRDSVWREWNASGELQVEKYYDNGRYIRTTADHRTSTPTTAVGASFRTLAVLAFCNDVWNEQQATISSIDVPENILDSIQQNIRTAWNCALVSDTSAAAVFTIGNRSALYADKNENETAHYIVQFNDLDSCVTTPQHCRTNNTGLNLFLDSLGLTWSETRWMPGAKRYNSSHKKNYRVEVTCGARVLNLNYINQRLNDLQRGSHIMLLRDQCRFPADIIYLPQGSVTNSGKLPVTVIAVADSWHPYNRNSYAVSEENWPMWIDGRVYHVFIVYGDGDAEYCGISTGIGVYNRFDVPHSAEVR